ncbi:hypothetical protein [Treponema sp. R8-4-B8]
MEAYNRDNKKIFANVSDPVYTSFQSATSILLNPVESEGGTGAIDLTFTFPSYAGVTKVIAFSNKYLPDFETTNGSRQEFDINNTVVFETTGDETTFRFYKDNVDAGDYFVTFIFYKGIKRLRVISEVVKVWNNFTSAKDIDVKIFQINVPTVDSSTSAPLAFTDRLDWIKTHAQSDVEYIIEVISVYGADFVETIAPYTLYLNNGASNVIVTLKGIKDDERSSTPTIKLLSKGSLFIVNQGITLNLDGYIDLEGIDGNIVPLVNVSAGGHWLYVVD